MTRSLADGTRLLATAVALLAGTLLAGCATGKTGASARVPAAEVRVYSSTQLAPTQYTVVQNLWIDQWRSNITYPTFASVDDGIQAMREKAAAAGATGLVHVMCIDATGYSKGRLLCYGDAIKFN